MNFTRKRKQSLRCWGVLCDLVALGRKALGFLSWRIPSIRSIGRRGQKNDGFIHSNKLGKNETIIFRVRLGLRKAIFLIKGGVAYKC